LNGVWVGESSATKVGSSFCIGAIIPLRAFVMASVESGDGVVILTNSENGLALAEPIVKSVLPGAHKVFRFYMLRGGR